MVNKYRKKPVVVEAIQYTGNNIEAIVKFIGCGVFQTEKLENGKWIKTFEIDTLEGKHIAKQGDFIIKGVAGEFYPCKPDIFKKTYDLVE